MTVRSDEDNFRPDWRMARWWWAPLGDDKSRPTKKGTNTGTQWTSGSVDDGGIHCEKTVSPTDDEGGGGDDDGDADDDGGGDGDDEVDADGDEDGATAADEERCPAAAVVAREDKASSGNNSGPAFSPLPP